MTRRHGDTATRREKIVKASLSSFPASPHRRVPASLRGLTKSQRNSYPAFARQSLACNSSEKTMKPKLITAIILLLVAALIVPAAQHPKANAPTATRDQQIAQAAE